MEKIILQEFAYNTADGKAGHSLAYSKVTSCLTVTCICSDGTIVGGHIVMIPFSLWYVTSNVAKLAGGKKITTVCLIGSTTWTNNDQLNDLLVSGNEQFFPHSRGGNVELERKFLAEAVTLSQPEGLNKAIGGIFAQEGIRQELSFFNGLFGGEFSIDFEGQADQAVLDVLGEKMHFPYTGQ